MVPESEQDNQFCDIYPQNLELTLELLFFLRGVNTMGLTIDRTVPTRFIGQKGTDGRIEFCYMMFFIPSYFATNTPAPLSIDIYVGYDWNRRCYVIPVSGNCTWKRALKIHKVGTVKPPIYRAGPGTSIAMGLFIQKKVHWGTIIIMTESGNTGP
eukprot:sb/3473209/